MSDQKTFALGGDLTVSRLGFGAMRLTGPGAWGLPANQEAALNVARRAVELGVDFIDTADSYGPGTNEEQLAAALHPYPERLVIGTKAGQTRPSSAEWVPVGRPEYLRQQLELSLRRLRLERIDLYQLHRVDPKVPAAEQFGVLADLQREGKIRHVGLSEVGVELLAEARKTVEIASVQNLYNLSDRGHEAVLEYCTREGIAFLPWRPVEGGQHAGAGGTIAEVAAELGATPTQVSLAWLLRHSPVVIPIPGTSSVPHLEENVGALDIQLTDDQYARLGRLASL